MPITLPKFYSRLADQLRKSKDFDSSLSAMLHWAAANEPHPAWARLLPVGIAGEIKAARAWIPRVLAAAPCPFPVRGIYFGLGEYESKRVEYADLYFALFGQCELSDPKSAWLWQKPSHYPDKARLRSKALKSGGLLCNGSGLSTEAYACYSLSLATLLLCQVLDGKLFDLLGGPAPIGVVAGFDSGDLLRLGSLSADGLSLTPGKMA